MCNQTFNIKPVEDFLRMDVEAPEIVKVLDNVLFDYMTYLMQDEHHAPTEALIGDMYSVKQFISALRKVTERE